MARRVALAMSGGVDSSTAALLLLKKGYEVIGLNLRVLKEQEYCTQERPDRCCGIKATEDARQVAGRLGIPFYVLNFQEEFEREVISYFCSQYFKGKTPNPCAVCNQRIKFGLLLDKAKALGANYLATGHYARVACKNGNFSLEQALDKDNDQSYFLFNLSQRQLRSSLFPLGKYKKVDIRKIAYNHGLDIYNKPKSQEICFIPNGDYRAFLKKRMPTSKPGLITDKNGKVLGKHTGTWNFTIGQRKKLGISSARPLYVLSIDAKRNRIIVGEREDLYRRDLKATGLNWMPYAPNLPFEAEVKLRYKQKRQKAFVYSNNHCRGNSHGRPKKGVKVRFKDPVWAPAPGQAVVLYDKDKVLGGGWIT